MNKIEDLLQKLRSNDINSTYFAEQAFSHDVQIYINTGSCNDGKFFGVREVRILVDRMLKVSPIFSRFELAKECEDQRVCHFRISRSSREGSKTTIRIRLNQSEDKIAYITVNLALAEVIAENYMKVLNAKMDAATFRNAFFTENVRVDVKNKLGRQILNYENLPGHMEAVMAKRQFPMKFHFTSRRVCVDREDDCDFEVTYRLGDEIIIMWGSLTETGDKITGDVVIRSRKPSYQ